MDHTWETRVALKCALSLQINSPGSLSKATVNSRDPALDLLLSAWACTLLWTSKAPFSSCSLVLMLFLVGLVTWIFISTHSLIMTGSGSFPSNLTTATGFRPTQKVRCGNKGKAIIIYLIFTTKWGRCNYSCFTKEETEVPEGAVTCPMLHSQWQSTHTWYSYVNTQWGNG